MIEAKINKRGTWVTGKFNEHTWPAAQKMGWIALDASQVLSGEKFPEIEELARKKTVTVDPVIVDDISPAEEIEGAISIESTEGDVKSETKGRGRPKKGE